MALDKSLVAGPEHFAGSGNVFSKGPTGLNTVVRQVLIRSAMEVITTADPDAFTDSGGQAVGMIFTAATTGICTSAAHGFVTGDGPIRPLNSGGALPTGMAATTDYYIQVLSANTFYVHTSKSGAMDKEPASGTRLDITGAGSGTNTLLCLHTMIRPTSDDGASATDSCTKATVDTAIATVENAASVLATYNNLFTTALGVGVIDVGGGTVATPGTLAAITVTVDPNTNDTTGTTYASFTAITLEVENTLRTLTNQISLIRRAAGMAEVQTPSGMLHQGAEDIVGVNGGDDFSVAVTTTATTIASSVTEAMVEAYLVDAAQNLQLLANQIEAVDTAAATPPLMSVIAG